MTVATDVIKVPDVGSSDPVDVIEVSVKEGDTIALEQTIVVLESDKATIEVPASAAGTVKKVLVKNGDRLKEGDPLLEVDAAAPSEQTSDTQADNTQGSRAATEPLAEPATDEAAPKKADEDADAQASTSLHTLRVPDLGDIEQAELIELSMQAGDTLEPDQVVAVLESDKASLEIPADIQGLVKKVHVTLGAKLATGDVLADIQVSRSAAPPSSDHANTAPTPPASEKTTATSREPVAGSSVASHRSAAEGAAATSATTRAGASVYAGPAVRKLARELGVSLAEVTGTGPKARVLKEDVHAHVKKLLTEKPTGSDALATVALPDIDFSRFGEVEEVELNKLRKVSATNLHRSWVTIPHVTQHDEADITELEAFRKSENKRLERQGVKLTMMAFLVKACAMALQAYPKFNTSLHLSGEKLIQKHFINIGVAVDTPNGLVVPVIKDADKKGLVEIAADVAALAEKARDKKLAPADMQGGTFSISSLGGIGGSFFTPIVNWPEVAILGVSRSQMKPVWDGQAFEPRLLVPLSLSYDHRVIDGADAARFITYLSELLADMRRGLL